MDQPEGVSETDGAIVDKFGSHVIQGRSVTFSLLLAKDIVEVEAILKMIRETAVIATTKLRLQEPPKPTRYVL